FSFQYDVSFFWLQFGALAVCLVGATLAPCKCAALLNDLVSSLMKCLSFLSPCSPCPVVVYLLGRDHRSGAICHSTTTIVDDEVQLIRSTRAKSATAGMAKAPPARTSRGASHSCQLSCSGRTRLS